MLRDLLSENSVRSMTDSGSWSRGQQYAKDGMISELEEFDNRITATVHGQWEYDVELWVTDKNEIGYECSCPMGDKGVFCKHCVATALIWMRQVESENAKAKKQGTKGKDHSLTVEDAQKYLCSLSKEELVEMVVSEMRNNKGFRQDILARTALNGGKGLSVVRARLKSAVKHSGFVYYEDSHGVAREIRRVIRSIKDHLSAKTADEIIVLCEEGIAWISDLILHADDSNGEIAANLGELEELHHNACRLARPDPVALAERLFALEMEGEWDTFYNAGRTYNDVLGKKGVGRYQELVMEAWNTQLASPPRADDWGSKRYHIEHLVTWIASETKNDPLLLKILKKNRYTYSGAIELACFYRDRKDIPKAIEIAEDGLQRVPDNDRLGDLLIELYTAAQHPDKAMEIRWRRFERYPILQSYRQLIGAAPTKKAKTKWRLHAIRHVQETLSRREKKQTAGFDRSTLWNGSVLVEIYLDETEPDNAWEAAMEYDCSPELWLELADARKETYPDDALSVWREYVEKRVSQTNNTSYLQAVEVLKKIKGLLTGLKRGSEFSEYLAQLRIAFRPKRNFMALLKETFGDG